MQPPKWVTPAAFGLMAVIGVIVGDELDRHHVTPPDTAWKWILLTTLPGVVLFTCLRYLLGRVAVRRGPSG